MMPLGSTHWKFTGLVLPSSASWGFTIIRLQSIGFGLKCRSLGNFASNTVVVSRYWQNRTCKYTLRPGDGEPPTCSAERATSD